MPDPQYNKEKQTVHDAAVLAMNDPIEAAAGYIQQYVIDRSEHTSAMLWHNLDEPARLRWKQALRLVLSGFLRMPTEDMLDAAEISPAEATAIWQRMIDALVDNTEAKDNHVVVSLPQRRLAPGLGQGAGE